VHANQVFAAISATVRMLNILVHQALAGDPADSAGGLGRSSAA
jgi:hypothetical protein